MNHLKSTLVLCSQIIFLGSVELSLNPSDWFGIAQAQSEIEVERSADVEEQSSEEQPEQNNQAFSVDFFEKMEEYQMAVDAEDFGTAKKVLDGLLASDSESTYTERAHVHRTYAGLTWDLEEIDEAIYHLKMIIEYGDYVEIKFKEQALYRLSQIYHQKLDDLETALDYLMQWQKISQNPSAVQLAYIAYIQYHLENYAHAILWIKRAIAMYEEQGLEPMDQWILILEQSEKKVPLSRYD